jgi:hypothetical protein
MVILSFMDPIQHIYMDTNQLSLSPLGSSDQMGFELGTKIRDAPRTDLSFSRSANLMDDDVRDSDTEDVSAYEDEVMSEWGVRKDRRMTERAQEVLAFENGMGIGGKPLRTLEEEMRAPDEDDEEGDFSSDFLLANEDGGNWDSDSDMDTQPTIVETELELQKLEDLDTNNFNSPSFGGVTALAVDFKIGDEKAEELLDMIESDTDDDALNEGEKEGKGGEEKVEHEGRQEEEGEVDLKVSVALSRAKASEAISSGGAEKLA